MELASDALYRRLPNGWGFTLSNEIRRAPSGELFEGVGVAPQAGTHVIDRPGSFAERLGAALRQGAALLLERAARSDGTGSRPFHARAGTQPDGPPPAPVL